MNRAEKVLVGKTLRKIHDMLMWGGVSKSVYEQEVYSTKTIWRIMGICKETLQELELDAPEQ